jgi:hypothetical protein
LVFNSDVNIVLSLYTTTNTADLEDGAGSMLVVSPGDLQNHVSAHNDIRDGHDSLPATFSPPPVDMDVVADATMHDAQAVAADAPADPAIDVFGAANPNGLGLAEPISFPQPAADVNGMGMACPDFSTLPLPSDERLAAFARLRFDDGSYYMHTYQIILGRNIHLARRDMRRIAKADQAQEDGQPQPAEDLPNEKANKKRHRRAARSVISEKGGIVSAPIDLMPAEYQRRQSNASHSLSSASHPTGDSAEEKPVQRAPQDMIMQAFPEVPPQFDGHVPENPHDCPLVPIHPQQVTARTGSHGPKGISRQHAKIFFDFDQGHFCIEVLGSNGLHHEGDFKHQGEIIDLRHGDHLVIGAVNMQFYLPDNALDSDQRDRQDSGSRPMSFAFENGHGELESDEHISSESEGQLSINPRHMYHIPLDSDLESDDMAGEDDDDGDDYNEPFSRSRQKPAPKLKLKIS